jgi:nicotinamidase-related amidase
MLFPPIPAFPLRDGGAALLVLDYQPFMVDRNVGLGRMATERGIARELDEYYEQVEYGLQNTSDLVQAFRAAGLPVIFTRLEASPSTGPTSDRYPYGGTLPTRDSPEAQVVPLLAPRPGPLGEYAFARSFLSPFVTTHVDKVLDGYGTRYVVLAGVMTGWAVELAAREAADRGYGVLVASDACPGETYAIHDFVMTQLVGGQIRVRPTASILEMLDGTRT